MQRSWGVCVCEREHARSQISFEGPEGKSACGDGAAVRRARRLGGGHLRWALVSMKALDVIPKQGRDRVRAVFGRSLPGCSPLFGARAQADSDI